MKAAGQSSGSRFDGCGNVVLVTGGAGFIGSNFVHYWRAKYPKSKLVVLDSLTYAASASSLTTVSDLSMHIGDIIDTRRLRQILEAECIDTIVHFAAETHVDRSIVSPDSFIETNVLGTHSLLKAAKAVWLDRGSARPHRFHHVSTDEVYGDLAAGELPFSDRSPMRPSSPYAASKAASDNLVHAYAVTYGLQVTASRCCNNYGPRQHIEKVIPHFVTSSLRGLPITLYGDGRNLREWMHVDDHCAAIDTILWAGEVGEFYNVGSGYEVSNLRLTDSICEWIDALFLENPSLAQRFPLCPPAQGRSARELITFVSDRPGHDFRYAIDSGRMRGLGYQPLRTFEQGIKETISWYVANEAAWTYSAASRAEAGELRPTLNSGE